MGSSARPRPLAGFSAVGFFFGRQLHQTLGVPIGLINDSWGGSACEAWIPRATLAADPEYKPLIEHWEQIEKDYPHRRKRTEWQAAASKARAEARTPQGTAQPGSDMTATSGPATSTTACCKPTIGYGIRGAIWYQGESNAGRAYQYRDLFPLMIQTWRDVWGQGDFSFYWVQLADFMAEKPEPAESAWAELREAQTMTMKQAAPHGRGRDHRHRRGQGYPPAEQAGRRPSGWPGGRLPRTTGSRFPARARPTSRWRSRATRSSLTFDHVGGGLRPFDVTEPRGFAIAGSDRKFVRARPRSSATTRSRSGPTRSPSRSPSATPGPTTRSATSTAPTGCRPRRSAPTTGRA